MTYLMPFSSAFARSQSDTTRAPTHVTIEMEAADRGPSRSEERSVETDGDMHKERDVAEGDE